MGLEKTYSGLHTQSSSAEHWKRAPKKGSFPNISIAPLKILMNLPNPITHLTIRSLGIT
jgi:hypothetical protein